MKEDMRRLRWGVLVLLIVLLSPFFFWSEVSVHGAEPLSPGDEPVRLLVKIPAGMSPAEFAQQFEPPPRRGILGVFSEPVQSPVKRVLLEWVALEVPASRVAELAVEEGYDVKRDTLVRGYLIDSVPLVNATHVWAFNNTLGNITGKNVTIAIIDSGIDYTHPDLGNCTNTSHLAGNCKVLPGYDYVNNDADALDDEGHGTHVAGIAGANGSAKGVAPDATLIAYKVLDSAGWAYASDVIAAIENASAAGYDIISLSLGGNGNADDAMSTAVDAAVNAGSVVVIAAGNSGPAASTIGSPGTARLAVTVGNTDKSDALHSTSSRGPNPGTLEIKPELTAPGEDISSTALGGGNTSMDGTSMSAPHVSGAAALIKQLHPSWSAAQIKAALVGSAKDLGFNLTDQGAGRLNALSAVNVSFIANPALLSLGTQSNRLNNVTVSFNLTELSNRTYNVSLSVSLRTGNATVSLNTSLVQLTALNTSENIELFINLTTTPGGVYSGLITANSSDTNISIPFWVQIAGWRTKTIETVSGGFDLYGVKIGDADNDGYNEMVLAVDIMINGWVRIGKYNTNGTWNFTNSQEHYSVHAMDIGDADNNGTNEIVVGMYTAEIGYFYWNGTAWDYVAINDSINYDTIDDLVIGDADNDGLNEIAAVTYTNGAQGSLYVFDFINNTWFTTRVHLCDCQRMFRLTIGDANNDSLNEIIARQALGGFDTDMYFYDNNSQTWNQTQIHSSSDIDYRSINVYDIDSDSQNEIILGGYDLNEGIVYVIEYLGNDTWNLSLNISATETQVDDIRFGDIDNDGVDELVVEGYNGATTEWYYYELTDGYSKYALREPMSKYCRRLAIGDATNNGLNEMGYDDGDNTNWFLLYQIEPPLFSQAALDASAPNAEDAPNLTISVQDSDPLSSVTLYSSTDGFMWNTTTMTIAYNYTYEGQIPRYDANTTVEYYVRAVDDTGDTNQTQIFNYTVLNLQGNATTVQSNISNLTVKIGGSENLTQTFLGVQTVEFSANGTLYVEFQFNFTRYNLDLSNTSVYAQEDNLTGWIIVKNLTLHAGTNKTLYLDHFNTSADAVCVKDAVVESVENISTNCTGLNETLVACINTSISGYRCENVSNRWRLYGVTHSAAKEMGNDAPQITATGPSSPVTSSSATLSATTNEAASCKYSTTQGQAYSAMPTNMTGTGTSHTASLTVSNGDYTYYVRCQDTGMKNSTQSTISFTVSIPTSSGGGGGAAPVTDKNKKETTYASLKPDSEHKLYVDRDTIAATKVGFVNTVQATNVKLSVSTVNTTTLDDPLDVAYDYFNVTLTELQAHELSTAWVEFKVNKDWLTEQSAAKEDVRLKRYQSGLWQELTTEWMKDTATYSYFNATTPGFSIFAIALAAKEPEPVVNITEPEVNKTVEPPVNETIEPPPPPVQLEKPRWWLTAIVLIFVIFGGGVAYTRFKRHYPSFKKRDKF